MGRSRNERTCNFLKGFIKWLIVEEHPVVVELPVETILNLAD